MSQPPTTVDWLNGGQSTMFFGQLVVSESTSDSAFWASGTDYLTGPVGAISGAPTSGIFPGDRMQVVIAGDAYVKMAPGLPPYVVGDPLYVSPNVQGHATNVRPPQNPFQIGVLKSIQLDGMTILPIVIAVLGAALAPTVTTGGGQSNVPIPSEANIELPPGVTDTFLITGSDSITTIDPNGRLPGTLITLFFVNAGFTNTGAVANSLRLLGLNSIAPNSGLLTSLTLRLVNTFAILNAGNDVPVWNEVARSVNDQP